MRWSLWMSAACAVGMLEDFTHLASSKEGVTGIDVSSLQVRASICLCAWQLALAGRHGRDNKRTCLSTMQNSP